MSKPASYNRHRAALVGLLSMLCASASHAAEGPTDDSLWYYAIGGAEPVSAPANPAVVSVTLGGSAELGLGYSCGKFDPVQAVTHSLNTIKSGANDMMNAMTAAASSAIAALPALILQRANPGLYDLFQNALLKAEETLQLATQVLPADGGRDRPGQQSLCRSHHPVQRQRLEAADGPGRQRCRDCQSGRGGRQRRSWRALDRWLGRWCRPTRIGIHRGYRSGGLQPPPEPPAHRNRTGNPRHAAGRSLALAGGGAGLGGRRGG